MRIGFTEIIVIGLVALMFYSPERAKEVKETIKGFLKVFNETKKEITETENTKEDKE